MTTRNGLVKNGRVYYCHFKHNGKTINKSTGCENYQNAQKWLKVFRDTLALTELNIGPSPTVEILFHKWLESHIKTSTVSHISRVKGDFVLHILPHIDYLYSDQVNSSHITLIENMYLNTIGPNNKFRTISGANALLRHLRLVFRWGVHQRLIREMPFKIKLHPVQRKPKTFLPKDKIEPFLQHIDSHTRNIHVRVAVRMMVYLGLRESEALGLRWEWFSDDLHTYTPGKTKGKEAVPLPVPDIVVEILSPLPRTSDWVLPAEDGMPHRAQFTKKAITASGKAIGLPKLTPHRLRGTCATLLSKNGVSTVIIQRMLRHKNIQTTLGYVETDLNDFREAQNSLL